MLDNQTKIQVVSNKAKNLYAQLYDQELNLKIATALNEKPAIERTAKMVENIKTSLKVLTDEMETLNKEV